MCLNQELHEIQDC